MNKNSRARLVFVSIKQSSRRDELIRRCSSASNQSHEGVCIGSIPQTAPGIQNYCVVYDYKMCSGNQRFNLIFNVITLYISVFTSNLLAKL